MKIYVGKNLGLKIKYIIKVILFLIVILNFSVTIYAESNDLQNSVKVFVNNSSISKITNEEIKRFIDDNKQKGEIYAICINEPSQSYPTIIKSQNVNYVMTEIFNRKIDKSEFEGDGDLNNYLKGYDKSWITDYNGREYLIIYKESNDISYISPLVLIIFIIGIVAVLILYKRKKKYNNNLDNVFAVGVNWYYYKDMDNLDSRIRIIEDIERCKEKCENIVNNSLKVKMNELNNVIDVCNRNSDKTDSKIHFKIDDLRNNYNEFNNHIDLLKDSIKSLEEYLLKLNEKLLKDKVNSKYKFSLVKSANSVTELVKKCLDITLEIEDSLGKACTLRFMTLRENTTFARTVDSDFFNISIFQNTMDELVNNIKEIINQKIMPLEKKMDNIETILETLQSSFKKTRENFDEIIYEISLINTKIDNMNYEDQLNYLKNILSGINSFKKEMIDKSSEMSGVVDRIKQTQIDGIDGIEALKNEYNSLLIKLETASEIIREMLDVQGEANEILKKSPGDVKVISKNTEIQKNVLNYIKKAKKNIYITIFALSDKDIISSLINTKSTSVKIKIIMDRGKYSDIINGRGNGGSSGGFGKNNINMEVAEKFNILIKQNNVKVRVINGDNQTTNYYVNGYMHRKEMVIDGEYALSGSANFTHGGFAYNIERLYIFTSKNYAERHEKDFNELWEDAIEMN